MIWPGKGVDFATSRVDVCERGGITTSRASRFWGLEVGHNWEGGDVFRLESEASS